MLANPMRGEADLAGHKLVVDFNGLCALEKATDRTVPELVVMMRTGVGFGFTEMRTFVRAFVDKPMSEEEVGNLIARAGMVERPIPKDQQAPNGPETEQTWRAAAALAEAFEGFFASQKVANENPRQAA